MVVFIAITVWDKQLWYKAESPADYPIRLVSQSIIRKYKFLQQMGVVPGIGVYGKSKRRGVDYSDLQPSFIEIYDIRLEKGKLRFQFRSHSNTLDCTSEKFLSKLEELGLCFPGKVMFEVIDDASWSRLEKELGIKPPEWWESLRRSTENKMLQYFQERFKEGRIYETADGHLVRSEAEVIIDDWLFYNNIVHAYEYRLPSQEAYCDFYLPKYNIYIEYWGVKGDPEYEERKKRKLEIYKKLGLLDRLIQLEADDIKNINSVLKRWLAKHGIIV